MQAVQNTVLKFVCLLAEKFNVHLITLNPAQNPGRNAKMSTPFTSLRELEKETDAEQVHSIIVEKYERCSFCNAKLLFSHDLNLHHFQVIEMGRCPACGVAMRPRKYTLH
ncbi:MAG: hypothetical protein HY537_07650 [Deltaproteobacteria bacterium]|nr:hypothetical protein [Deltaproteobacteria bacterium]